MQDGAAANITTSCQGGYYPLPCLVRPCIFVARSKGQCRSKHDVMTCMQVLFVLRCKQVLPPVSAALEVAAIASPLVPSPAGKGEAARGLRRLRRSAISFLPAVVLANGIAAVVHVVKQRLKPRSPCSLPRGASSILSDHVSDRELQLPDQDAVHRAITPFQRAELFSEWLAVLKAMLQSSGVQLPAGVFTEDNTELMHFAMAHGLHRVSTVCGDALCECHAQEASAAPCPACVPSIKTRL
jgi:hypothetical protein